MRHFYLIALLGLAVNGRAAPDQSILLEQMDRILPPPGLYLVEKDATAALVESPMSTREQHSGQVQTLTNKSGDQVVQQKRSLPQDTTCVPPRQANAPLLLPSFGHTTCQNVSTTVTGNSLKIVAQCPTGRIAHTVTKLDDKHWENISDTEWGAGGAARNNFGSMRPMLEQMARSAPTQADRDKAKQLLATLPRRQAELDRQMAAATAGAQQAVRDAQTPEEAAAARKAAERMENQASLPPQFKGSGRERWTRIADRCGAGKG